MTWTNYYNWMRGTSDGVTVYLYPDRANIFIDGYSMIVVLFHGESPFDQTSEWMEEALS